MYFSYLWAIFPRWSSLIFEGWHVVGCTGRRKLSVDSWVVEKPSQLSSTIFWHHPYAIPFIKGWKTCEKCYKNQNKRKSISRPAFFLKFKLNFWHQKWKRNQTQHQLLSSGWYSFLCQWIKYASFDSIHHKIRYYFKSSDNFRIDFRPVFDKDVDVIEFKRLEDKEVNSFLCIMHSSSFDRTNGATLKSLFCPTPWKCQYWNIQNLRSQPILVINL